MTLLFEAVGWDMYDPRMTLKAAAGEDIEKGACCWIHTDGLIYLSDDSEDKVHGCALTDAKSGDELVLVTHGRLKVVDTNTIGNLAYGQANDGGSVPNTTNAGHVCGFCIAATMIFVHIDSVSAAA